MVRGAKLFKSMLAGVTLASMLAACSSKEEKSEGTSSPAPASVSAAVNTVPKDPYEIALAIPVFGAIPKDMEAVQVEINKITQAKINASIKILPISIGAWQQQMNLMTSGAEKLDIAFSFGQSYASQVASGILLPTKDLLAKYGKGIEQAVGVDYLKSAQINGQLYGVPTIHDYAGQSGIMLRKDLVEKYNINVGNIKSFNDLDNVFKTIKDNEPNIVPLGVGIAGVVSSHFKHDMLGDRYGVLPGFDNGLKVENYYESAEYTEILNKLNTWFQAGYVNKDAATTKVPEADLMKAGKSFSYFVNYHPAMLNQEERKSGNKLVYVPLDKDHYATTSKVMVGLWGISQNSKNPERAMMFLDLMYTNKEIVNLMLWGIEGKHYVKVSDNVIDYPAGIDSTTVTYKNEFWLMGNPFLSYVMKGEDPDIWNKVKAFNDSAVKSKALGFTFNAEPVKNEITAINNTKDQYAKILESGTIDPSKKLPEFISKLKAAGLDKVIAEKQKQLNDWTAAQNKK